MEVEIEFGTEMRLGLDAVDSHMLMDYSADTAAHNCLASVSVPATGAVSAQNSASAVVPAAVDGFGHTAPAAQLAAGCTSAALEAEYTAAVEAEQVAQVARSGPEAVILVAVAVAVVV